jgi:alpha-maltose-1-phosphate synthase
MRPTTDTGGDRPRVALLTKEYPPEVYGGAGVHVAELARALTGAVDLEIHCFGRPREDALVAGAYQPWEALAGDRPELQALRTISQDLLMVDGVAGADLVHSHTWYANLAGHLAKLVHGVPHVVTTHSLEPLRPWKREQLGGGYELSSFCERTAVEAADAVIAVSEGMRDDVLRAYPTVDPDRVVVIHNGVDPDDYRPTTETDALERHGVDATRPYAVFVGRITRQKGVVHLLDAAAHLPAGSQLVLCAGAPDTDDIATEFRRRVAELAAGPVEVVWIEEMLPRAEVVQILSHARVFVCPSVYEPFGIVNLEAMACGLPVVASAVGGIPEIVLPGETGHLVEVDPRGDALGTPRDPDRFARQLADRIAELLADEAGAAAMGAAGRRRVEEHFSWAAIAAQTAGLYRRLAT